MKKILGKYRQTFEDNAAVQSIRRSKVKCYDLIVKKNPSDSSCKAFYVNSNQKFSDGKYYPAYMYVENTVVNSTNINSVADATGSGNSYFSYGGLYYANGEKEYNRSSLYIVNTAMALNDWDWEN